MVGQFYLGRANPVSNARILLVTRGTAEVAELIAPNQYAKFAFDSRKATPHLIDIRKWTPSFGWWPLPGSGSVFYRYPASTEADVTHVIESVKSGTLEYQIVHVRMSKMGLGYHPVESRYRDIASGAVEGPNASDSNRTSGSQTLLTNQWFSTAGAVGGAYKLIDGIWDWWASFQTASSRMGVDELVLSTWDLPVNSDPIYATATPISGQCVVELSRYRAVMCRPGYDVDTAPRNAKIFDSNLVPAKLAKCGVVAMNNGATAYVDISTAEFPYNLTEQMNLVYHARATSVLRPSGVDDLNGEYLDPPITTLVSGPASFRVKHKIDTFNRRIYFYSDYTGIDVRVVFALFAEDDNGVTSGGSTILSKANDGTQDYVRLKRPGSSDGAPKMNDIILDSRLYNLPIIQEGWLPYTSFSGTSSGDNYNYLGKNYVDVPLSNDGTWFPLVRAYVYFADGTSRSLAFRSFNRSWAGVEQANNGNLVRIKKDNLRFYMSRGNNTSYTSVSGGFEGVYDTGQDPSGIRYYVFALPIDPNTV